MVLVVVQEAASHADPRTTMRFDRARVSLDRHATYIVSTFIAGRIPLTQTRPLRTRQNERGAANMRYLSGSRLPHPAAGAAPRSGRSCVGAASGREAPEWVARRRSARMRWRL